MKIHFVILAFSFLSFFNANGQNKSSSNSEFEYEDCSCAIPIELTIYNGLYGNYGGNVVLNKDKIIPGAVTVANMNDTDGDTYIDNSDMIVTNGPNGRDEVDLMKLEIKIKNGAPQTNSASCRNLELVLKGAIKLWQKSTKEIVQNTTIPISSLPLTVWVEAIAPSNKVQDIEIEAFVNGQSKDLVKATAVWVQFSRKYKSKALSGIENSSALTLDINEQNLRDFIEVRFKDILNQRYGLGANHAFNSGFYSGTCQTSAYSSKNAGYGATILTEYTVLPTDLRTQPNMLGVKFDFARQLDADESIISSGSAVWLDDAALPDLLYSNGNEGSNDDKGNKDEDLTPSMHNKIYSLDSPGFSYDSFYSPRNIAFYRRDLDFKEFARVSFNMQPSGDGTVIASRCSEYLLWDTEYTLKRQPISGVIDIYDDCNHGLAQVNTALSHSAIRRIKGQSIPSIQIIFLNINSNAAYQFEYNSSMNSWRLIKLGSTGGSNLGFFPYNSSSNNWTLKDGAELEIIIEDSGSVKISNSDTFRFSVNSSLSKNILN